MSEHTPTPWRLDADPFIVCFGEGDSICDCAPGSPYIKAGVAKANAAFIVKAVNSHEPMVDAIRNYLAVFDRCGGSESVSPEEFAEARARLRAVVGTPTGERT